MQRTAATIAAIILMQALLVGCSDSQPPEASMPSVPASEATIPQTVQQPPSLSSPFPSSGAPKEGQPSAAQTEPSPASDPAKSAGAVTGQVYAATPATKPATGDSKAVSWYYMKQGKGKVPNFPAETKRMKPSQKAVWVGSGKKVYLTFDNGGPMGDTKKMLKVLKDNNVKASYFIAGYNMKKHADFVRKLVEDGHFIANHSMSHKDFTEMTDEQVKKEITDFAALYKETTGKEIAPVFRFPFGRYSFHLLNVVADMGYTSVFWSTAMKDWEPRKNGWTDAYNDIMNNLHDGDVILLHQASQENMDALDKVIKAIRKEGYEFGTVDELVPKS